MTPQETEPDLPVSVQESLGEVWVDSGLPGLTGVRGKKCNSPRSPRAHWHKRLSQSENNASRGCDW